MKVNELEFDPRLVATVERALEPYKRRYPPEMVEHFRREALVQLSLHPYSAALIQQLKPDPEVKGSGPQPTEEGATLEPALVHHASNQSGHVSRLQCWLDLILIEARGVQQSGAQPPYP